MNYGHILKKGVHPLSLSSRETEFLQEKSHNVHENGIIILSIMLAVWESLDTHAMNTRRCYLAL